MFTVGKLCSLCCKGHFEFRRHNYTVFNKVGKPVQLDNCGFIACPFCQASSPDAPTVERINKAKESE